MQQLKPGDFVRARSAHWHVADIRDGEGCQMVTLARADPQIDEKERVLLTPFDTIERVERNGRIRTASPRRWRRECRALLSAHAPAGSLRSARDARMDLHAYQLEPSLAVLRGLGSRVLLADDVGLGKTVQAGLVAGELRARGWADRILILTPAGLRDQWASELRDRLALETAIVDAAEIRRLASALPVDLNPWTTMPVVIASIDYVKRPEVLPAVSACRWDVVIVDEAHGVTLESERQYAVALLARHAAYLLMLTATPHSGDRRAFSSLCGLGRLDDDPLLVFRRSREDVGLGHRRRVRRLHVSPSEAETRMYGLLARFARAVRRERGESAALGLSVLHKRASSSAHSLELSVGRRLAALAADSPADVSGAVQCALPLGDDSGELSAADEPPLWSETLALGDRERERRLLGDIRDAARAAALDETKMRVLRRLLRRIREPALIFTEYRDTLLHLRDRLDGPVAVLHGGLDRQERAAALAAFSSGRTPALLATDAAGEGLNLHHACRLVINLELPWNPMRLEQRIGRIDRIGQRRTVHVIHLIARHTSEGLLLRRLRERIASARADIRAPNPLGSDQPSETAGLPDGCLFPHLASEASSEAQRLVTARLSPGGNESTIGVHGPWLMRTRRPLTRMRLGGQLLLLFVIALEDACRRPVESTIVPVFVARPTRPVSGRSRAADVATLIGLMHDELRQHVAAAADQWLAGATAIADAFVAARLRRERAIADVCERAATSAAQPGLFDRRAEVAFQTAREINRDRQVEQRQRIAGIEATAMRSTAVRLALILAP